jgi:hypothetical protein
MAPQEAALFTAWAEELESRRAAAEAAMAKAAEEEAEVGPQLPGAGLVAAAKGNLGGFLLPGEGDRWVGLCGVFVLRWGGSGVSGGKGVLLSGERDRWVGAVRGREGGCCVEGGRWGGGGAVG